MMEKHLTAPAPVLPEGPPPPPLVFTSKVGQGRLFTFPVGSCVGGSDFKPQYFKDMVECPNTFVSSESLEFLTTHVHCIVVGKASQEIASSLSGAPLIALNKRRRGLCPITI